MKAKDVLYWGMLLLLVCALVAALSSCSKRVVTEVATGQRKVVRPYAWSDSFHVGDTIGDRKGRLYVVKH
jgi:hypothetical protein